MKDNKIMLDQEISWISFAEAFEIIFITVSAMFTPVFIPVISFFFLLQISTGNRTISVLNVIWHILACIFFAFTQPVMLYLGILTVVISLKTLTYTIKDNKQKGINMSFKSPAKSVQNNISSSNSTSDQVKTIILDDDKHSDGSKRKGRLRLPQNSYEFCVVLSIIIIILGGMNLHPLNWVCCAVEAFFLACALLPKNAARTKNGIIAHIADIAFLVVVSPHGSNFLVYLFLLFMYAIQTFLYRQSYFIIRNMELQKKEVEEYRLAKEQKYNQLNTAHTIDQGAQGNAAQIADNHSNIHRREISLIKCQPQEISYRAKKSSDSDSPQVPGQMMSSISVRSLNHNK